MSGIERPSSILVRETIGEIVRSKKLLDRILQGDAEARKRIKKACKKIKNDEVIRKAKSIPVEVVNTYGGRFRVSALKRHGIYNIYDLYANGERRIRRINGISEESAYCMSQIAEQIMNQLVSGVGVKISNTFKTAEMETVVAECSRLIEEAEIIEKAKKTVEGDKTVFSTHLVSASKLKSGWLGWIVSSNNQKAIRTQALKELENAIKRGLVKNAEDLSIEFDRIKNDEKISERGWEKFASNAAQYYALLEEIDGTVAGPSSRGNVSKDLAHEVDSVALNIEEFKGLLRDYQAFGAKYILHQRKVLLGDEMGLGKTIQAIAAMNHLFQNGCKHFMVVCPLSILINWQREIERFSNLPVYKFRGSEKIFIKGWIENGGVAITNYESVSRLGLPEGIHLDMLIADEAHFIKNPNAIRTQEVLYIKRNADRVLFMTGTPLENRLEEMLFLIEQLNSSLANRVSQSMVVYSEDAFKRKIAPVYLRRLRDDVLNELPEKIELDDWCEMNDEERMAYANSLRFGSFMDVRRVSWNVFNCDNSTKLHRLKEICEEASNEEKKVVVFSFFLKTIDVIMQNLTNPCFGPLSGRVSSAERQRILDEFDKAPNGSVLVAQINTAGVGINIQSASVVVICEPQWKPTVENQAISRVYRMGQVNTVIVHRLLSAGSVDERMVSLLRKKESLFERYANKSAMGELSETVIKENTIKDLVNEEMKAWGIGKEQRDPTKHLQKKVDGTSHMNQKETPQKKATRTKEKGVNNQFEEYLEVEKTNLDKKDTQKKGELVHGEITSAENKGVVLSSEQRKYVKRNTHKEPYAIPKELFSQVSEIVFDGKRFVFRGVFDNGKKEGERIINKVEELGGIVRWSISGITDYIVVNQDSDSIRGLKEVVKWKEHRPELLIINQKNLENILFGVKH